MLPAACRCLLPFTASFPVFDNHFHLTEKKTPSCSK
jgi:hypothetical protein